jgi:hypothetical protein
VGRLRGERRLARDDEEDNKGSRETILVSLETLNDARNQGRQLAIAQTSLCARSVLDVADEGGCVEGDEGSVNGVGFDSSREKGGDESEEDMRFVFVKRLEEVMAGERELGGLWWLEEGREWGILPVRDGRETETETETETSERASDREVVERDAETLSLLDLEDHKDSSELRSVVIREEASEHSIDVHFVDPARREANKDERRSAWILLSAGWTEAYLNLLTSHSMTLANALVGTCFPSLINSLSSRPPNLSFSSLGSTILSSPLAASPKSSSSYGPNELSS